MPPQDASDGKEDGAPDDGKAKMERKEDAPAEDGKVDDAAKDAADGADEASNETNNNTSTPQEDRTTEAEKKIEDIKKKRSDAAKKGWETRRHKIAQNEIDPQRTENIKNAIYANIRFSGSSKAAFTQLPKGLKSLLKALQTKDDKGKLQINHNEKAYNSINVEDLSDPTNLSQFETFIFNTEYGTPRPLVFDINNNLVVTEKEATMYNEYYIGIKTNGSLDLNKKYRLVFTNKLNLKEDENGFVVKQVEGKPVYKFKVGDYVSMVGTIETGEKQEKEQDISRRDDVDDGEVKDELETKLTQEDYEKSEKIVTSRLKITEGEDNISNFNRQIEENQEKKKSDITNT